MSYAVGVPTVRARNSLIVLEGAYFGYQILELRSYFLPRHAITESDGQVNYLPSNYLPSRRWRCEYARSARRKSTRRKSGQ